MESDDGSHHLEFQNTSTMRDFVFESDMVVVCCMDSNTGTWSKSERILNENNLVEHSSWISRLYAETLLEDKQICFVAGVCTAQRLADVLGQIPEYKSKYNFCRVQVNVSKNINEAQKEFRHLQELCGMYIYTILGKEYDVFYPENFALNPECQIYKIPSAEMNFLLPQIPLLPGKNRNPYRIHVDGITKRIPFEYKDENVIYCVEQGYSAQETLEYCLNEDLYSREDLERNIKTNIRMLKIAENGCNILFSPFFSRLYQNIRLMRDPLHYSAGLFIQAARQLCEECGIHIQGDIENQDSNIRIPYYHSEICIYPSVIRKLELGWCNDAATYEVYFNEKTKKLNFSQYILAYYDYVWAVKNFKKYS